MKKLNNLFYMEFYLVVYNHYIREKIESNNKRPPNDDLFILFSSIFIERRLRRMSRKQKFQHP